MSVSSWNGAISISGARGKVDANSIYGFVNIVEAVSRIDAGTSSGDLSVSYASTDGSGGTFKGGSGSVTVRLPSDVSGWFDAKAAHGYIHTDFPLIIQWLRPKRRIRAEIGESDPTYKFRTSFGSINILKS